MPESQRKQIMGYTGDSPPSGFYAPYIMAFDVGGGIEIEVRGEDGESRSITIPKADCLENLQDLINSVVKDDFSEKSADN